MNELIAFGIAQTTGPGDTLPNPYRIASYLIGFGYILGFPSIMPDIREYLQLGTPKEDVMVEGWKEHVHEEFSVGGRRFRTSRRSTKRYPQRKKNRSFNGRTVSKAP